MSLKHVLVVDDDPLILEVMSRGLASAALRISTARRVSVARDVLMRDSVDLLITDARIPGETGLQLAADAKDLGIATIVMSGNPEWAAEHGMLPENYVVKPFDLPRLRKMVEERLGFADDYARVAIAAGNAKR